MDASRMRPEQCAKLPPRSRPRPQEFPGRSSYLDRSLGNHPFGKPLVDVNLVALAQNALYVVSKIPIGIVGLELIQISNPPDVISHPAGVHILPLQLDLTNTLADCDRFEHRAVTKTTAADVIDLARPGIAKEGVKCLNQVIAMNIVADLFSLIAEYLVWSFHNTALHQVSQESMKLSTRVLRTSETS